MKRFKQLLVLLLVLVLFVTFNGSIYLLFTSRCAANFGTSAEARAMAIDVENYLPFHEDSKIVKLDASVHITENIPVIDGAAALLPVFSAFAHALYPPESCHFDGENFTADSALQFRNTRGAYKAVVDGEVDMVFCVSPSQEQLAYAEAQNVELVFVPIGLEAFVFLVNNNNPVEGLTQDQIRGIYSGQYTNWSQVGGSNRIINPLTRQTGSGSQTALLNFLGCEETAIKKPFFAPLGGALGFSFRYYVEGIVENGQIKLLCIDGVYPSEENIRNGTYPIINELYAVYRADNQNPNLPTLLEWVLSDEGQQIVSQSGYVPIN